MSAISRLTIMTPAKKRIKKTAAWSLYVLKCRDNTFYTGITNDLTRRIIQHNNGTASRYTRSRLPAKLIYQEKCRGRSQALKKEYALKQLSRKEKEAYIRDNG
jgi:putative endonuclease